MKNNKKKALVSAILTIALCFSVIAGATFALFTSKDEVNIAVTSGKVNLTATIDTESLKLSSLGVDRTNEGKFAVGGTATFDNERKLNLTNIVPGDKATFEIDVTNNSNVDVMYKLAWKVDNTELDALVATATVENETEALEATDWIEWKTPANDAEKTKTIVASIELPAGAGDDYQDKIAKVSFTVEAIQANAIVEEVTTAEQLVSALENGTSSVTILNDIVIDDTINIPENAITTLNLNGKTITNENGVAIENKGNLTIIDSAVMTLSADAQVTSGAVKGTSLDASARNAIQNFGTMVITGGTYESVATYAINNQGTMTINDATVIGMGAIYTYNGTLTINGGNYYAKATWQSGENNGAQHTLYVGNSTVVIKDGNFDATVNGATNAMVMVGPDADITIENGNFVSADVNSALPEFPVYMFSYEDTGKLVINDGTFFGGWRFNKTATTDIYGGTFNFNADQCNFTTHDLTVYGGSFAGGFATNYLEANVAEYFLATDNGDGTFTVAQDPMVFFVKDDAELAAAINAINTDSKYWNNSDVTVVLAAGEYDGNYELKQWPTWNGITGGTAATSTTDKTIVTFVGAEGAVITGTMTVRGNGNGQGSYVEGMATNFENVEFDPGMPADYSGADVIGVYVESGAHNVTFTDCKFENSTHVRLGSTKHGGTGNVSFYDCTFTNSGCITGGTMKLLIDGCNFNGSNNGFVNVQRGGNGAGIVTVTDTTVVAGAYAFRTNALADITATNSTFNIVEAGEAYDAVGALVCFRGDNASANFVNCKLSYEELVTYKADSYKATSKVSINGVEQKFTEEITTNEAIDEAIGNGYNAIVLGDGNYIIPDSAQGKTLMFIGNGNTVVATQDDGSYEGCDYSLDGSNVVFDGIVINTDSTTYTGYARLNATYNNCTINGMYTLYGDSVFNNCTFNVSGDVYNIWTWGAPTAEFNNCTFNTSGKAILLYGGTNTKLIVNNCVFNDDDAYANVNNKAAIEVGSDWTTDKKEVIVTNTTVNGFDITDKGTSTGTTLWGNKNSLPQSRLNVVVDGVDVY